MKNWTPESVPAPMVEAYREAWHAADDEMGTAGPAGYRTRAGLAAALNAADLDTLKHRMAALADLLERAAWTGSDAAASMIRQELEK